MVHLGYVANNKNTNPGKRKKKESTHTHTHTHTRARAKGVMNVEKDPFDKPPPLPYKGAYLKVEGAEKAKWNGYYRKNESGGTTYNGKLKFSHVLDENIQLLFSDGGLWRFSFTSFVYYYHPDTNAVNPPSFGWKDSSDTATNIRITLVN